MSEAKQRKRIPPPRLYPFPVQSIRGEWDQDHEGVERRTTAGSIGLAMEWDPEIGEWNLHFPNGATVWASEDDLARKDCYRFGDDLKVEGASLGRELREQARNLLIAAAQIDGIDITSELPGEYSMDDVVGLGESSKPAEAPRSA